MSDEARFTAIETKLMHLEDQLEDMNAVVLEQDKTIKRLKMMLEDLQSAPEDHIPAAHQKPPHY